MLRSFLEYPFRLLGLQSRGKLLKLDFSKDVCMFLCVYLCMCFQDAVEENEQRKKQEEAMREKLLAQEAKQHDPKV